MGTYTLPDTFTDRTGPPYLQASNLNEWTAGINGLDARVINLEGFAAVPAGYQYTGSPLGFGLVNTSGVGTMRAYPWVLTKPMTMSKIGAEVSTVGDTGSKVRLGLYADNGSGSPGNLIIDAGQIAGDSATVQELTVSKVLQPGLYWPTSVVQAVTTTQPTIRVIPSTFNPPIPIGLGGSIPVAGNTVCGFAATGVTGALPSTFSPTLLSGLAARVFVYLS